MDTQHGQPPRPLVWWYALRPKTLSLAAAPVLAGTAWAVLAAGVFRAEVLVLALACATAIQVATNLWNDALDSERGVDRGLRLGPRRATAAGWLTTSAVRRMALVVFGLAAALGLVLVGLGGWPILAIGAAGIACGLAYSAGPYPLASTPFGEIAVLAFFGIAGVAGTVLLHGAAITAEVLLLGVVIGLPAAAVLLVNNHRDRVCDARAGRRTLAILLGPRATQRLYGALLAAAALGPVALRPSCAVGWLASAALTGGALVLARRFARTPLDPVLNRFLAATGRFQLVVVAATAVALALCG
ncbi:MAG: 1,4-dihydroxy-2-naphthoate octaprenyltransferase [Alphaproteobacteria bacterium]